MYKEMKSLGNWLVYTAFIALFLASCFEPPVYSKIPAIEFDNITFIDVANPSDPDSLILSIKFKDGDGDLGLDANNPYDTMYPYHNKAFFDTTGAKYYYPAFDPFFISYKTKRTNPKFDTLPAFAKPYYCVNWEVKTSGNKVDTFYYELNPNHHNIFIDFLVKNNDGTFKEFDWMKEFAYPNCGITLDGRFPVLSKDLGRASPLDGKIRYAMGSVGYTILFSIKTLKLRIMIQDRGLNKSNIIETPEFTLQQIKKAG